MGMRSYSLGLPLLLALLPSCLLFVSVDGDFTISGRLFSDSGCLGLRDGDHFFVLHRWDGVLVPQEGAFVILKVRTRAFQAAVSTCTFGEAVDVVEVLEVTRSGDRAGERAAAAPISASEASR